MEETSVENDNNELVEIDDLLSPLLSPNMREHHDRLHKQLMETEKEIRISVERNVNAVLKAVTSMNNREDYLEEGDGIKECLEEENACLQFKIKELIDTIKTEEKQLNWHKTEISLLKNKIEILEKIISTLQDNGEEWRKISDFWRLKSQEEISTCKCLVQ